MYNLKGCWPFDLHQVHLIGALKISSVAFISWIEVLSSDLIPVLSLTNVEPVQYILEIFYDFFHKSIAVTIANSNISFQMRIYRFASVLAYFATTMVCDVPILIFIYFRCNFYAQTVMYAFVWTDKTFITIMHTESVLYIIIVGFLEISFIHFHILRSWS